VMASRSSARNGSEVGPELTHQTLPEARQVGPELTYRWGRNSPAKPKVSRTAPKAML
jgi:hypothetical protein